MKVRIEIDCNNAAFEDNPYELGNVLRHLGEMLDGAENIDMVPVYDSNGNRVGLVEIDPPVCCLCKR